MCEYITYTVLMLEPLSASNWYILFSFGFCVGSREFSCTNSSSFHFCSFVWDWYGSDKQWLIFWMFIKHCLKLIIILNHSQTHYCAYSLVTDLHHFDYIPVLPNCLHWVSSQKDFLADLASTRGGLDHQLFVLHSIPHLIWLPRELHTSLV